jgi:hypothetical protein
VVERRVSKRGDAVWTMARGFETKNKKKKIRVDDATRKTPHRRAKIVLSAKESDELVVEAVGECE